MDQLTAALTALGILFSPLAWLERPSHFGPPSRAVLKEQLYASQIDNVPGPLPSPAVFLLVSTLAGKPETTFGEYSTMEECRMDLAPLSDRFACIELSESSPARPGWVNGPSAGVWVPLTEEFNEKARRGLWRHRQIDLWRTIMAQDDSTSIKDQARIAPDPVAPQYLWGKDQSRIN
jgi:hypothetical protein